MSKLFEMKHKIFDILNMIKGFEVGYTSNVKDKIIIDYEGERYVVHFEKVENPNKNMYEDIKLYLK